MRQCWDGGDKLADSLTLGALWALQMTLYLFSANLHANVLQISLQRRLQGLHFVSFCLHVHLGELIACICIGASQFRHNACLAPIN